MILMRPVRHPWTIQTRYAPIMSNRIHYDRHLVSVIAIEFTKLHFTLSDVNIGMMETMQHKGHLLMLRTRLVKTFGPMGSDQSSFFEVFTQDLAAFGTSIPQFD